MLLKRGPQPGLILSGEKIQGSNNIGEIGDKLVIEVGEPQEGLDPFDRGRGFPFTNCSEFGRVHFDPSLTNNHAQEIHARSVEDTFRQLEGKSMFSETKENTMCSFVM
jgi:hypothetical protein